MLSFSFSNESLLTIADLLKHYPSQHKSSAVLPLLDIAQRENEGWLSTPAMEAVANLLDMTFIRVCLMV